ncbi:MAG: DNA gyrase subunit A [Chloroflexi bacterium RBG_16_68_14]|nr:MAG: DNA gyrase subunit A [Chloroflexi bacterium RBG_16_68_14]
MTTDGNIGTIRPVKIEEEMRASYLDYAMSVIVARALPDARDGLKPVQRRILYAMHALGLRPTSRYRKSAGIVGEVLKSYHPHGDAPVYEAMVRMAQPFSLRYPLIDGQGNFGSVDNDPPAAMRYTEARLSPIAEEMLADIDRNTVDFVPNYDDSLREPMPLPARLPNLLVNGASGIAVGMATSIPPHNLGEICDALARLIDDPETTTEELAEVVKGPDFPTGGIIYRLRREHEYDAEGKRKDVLRDAVKQTYGDGRGRVVVQARTHIEETARGGRMQIIVSELPYQVNKAALIERIATLVRDKKIDGISDLRDESDRHGMRIVIELSRTGQARQVLNALFKHTPMQATFPVNMLALVEGQPRVINLKTALEQYIHFRRVVIRRRAEFDLEKAREREHILQGLLTALQHLDQVIQTIRRAQSAEEAKQRLMARPFNLSDRQAQAVLDMQLRRLARLEQQKLEDEFREIIQLINELEDLLANPRKIDFIIKEDVRELKQKYGDERRTQIVAQEVEQFTEEDLVAHQEAVITLSNRGYIKRLPLETYRPQRRGGRGITGMVTREADAVHRLVVADTHDSLLFFTDRGRVFRLRVFDVPDASRQARGIPLINLIEIDQRELVTAVVAARDFQKDAMVLATATGEVKKTSLSEFASVRRAGLIAMDLEANDVLVSAKLAEEGDEVLIVTSDGQSVRFPVAELRSASRASGGVRGVRLGKGARLVSMDIVSAGDELLTLSAHGFGKRTPVEEYPVHHRGGGGVITFKVLEKTGPVVAARMVRESQELIVISQDGIVLRTRMDGIAVQGRSTQGVSIIGPAPGDTVASLAVIEMEQQQEAATAEGPEPSEPPRPQKKGKKAPAQPSAPKAKPAAKAKPATKPKAAGKAATVPKQKAARPVARSEEALAKANAALSKAKAALAKTRAAGSTRASTSTKGRADGRGGRPAPRR